MCINNTEVMESWMNMIQLHLIEKTGYTYIRPIFTLIYEWDMWTVVFSMLLSY